MDHAVDVDINVLSPTYIVEWFVDFCLSDIHGCLGEDIFNVHTIDELDHYRFGRDGIDDYIAVSTREPSISRKWESAGDDPRFSHTNGIR